MAHNPPDLLKLGVAQAIAALQREEMELRQHVLDFHQPIFRGLREELRRWFLGHFVVQLTPENEKQQVWDFVKVQQDQLLPVMLDTVHETLAVLHEEDADLFEEELDAAMVEGFERELWLLGLGGLPAEEYGDRLPDQPNRHAWLLTAGVLGLAWQNRLARWREESSFKAQQWVRSSVIGGRTLDDTLQGFDRLATQFDGQVTGLLGNELHRAYSVGAGLAFNAVSDHYPVDEVWMTRQDAQVCPVCEELHMKVTRLQPIIDTHPGCRCMKVPVPDGYTPTPMTYGDFLDRLDETDYAEAHP